MPRYDWICDYCGAEETLKATIAARDDNPGAVNGSAVCPNGSWFQEYGSEDGSGGCRWQREWTIGGVIIK
jgi:hypothetical protein